MDRKLRNFFSFLYSIILYIIIYLYTHIYIIKIVRNMTNVFVYIIVVFLYTHNVNNQYTSKNGSTFPKCAHDLISENIILQFILFSTTNKEISMKLNRLYDNLKTIQAYSHDNII